MEHSFLATHNDWDARQRLAFVVPAEIGADLYSDPMWSIQIDGVLVDGHEVPPKPFDGKLDDIDFGRIETRGMAVVFQSLMAKLRVAGHFASEDDYALLDYEIPIDAQLIEIRYRPRILPGVLGPDCLLVSMQS